MTAPICLAMSMPSSVEMGVWFFSRSLATVFASERRSSLVPTQMIGTPGQWCFSSGYHFCLVFSNEARLMSEKATRKTSVCG